MGELLTLAQVAAARHTRPLVLLRFCRRHNVPVYRESATAPWTLDRGALAVFDAVWHHIALNGPQKSEATCRRETTRRRKRAVDALIKAQAATISEELILRAAVKWKTIGSGVYFLIKSGRVIYVGQAVNVTIRVATHATTKDFDSWHWIPCQRNRLDTLERAYINALMPPLNRDGATRRARSSLELEARDA